MNATVRDGPVGSASVWHRLDTTPLRDLIRGRLTGRLSVDDALTAARLPPSLSMCVCDVVRRTRLWRLEKVDVARELAAHFQDGLEAGASAEELAASFGDLRQAAWLIRRAKRRQRPLAWKAFKLVVLTIGFAFLFVVVAFAVVYGIQAARIYSHSPNIARNFLAEWNRPALAVPETERAWPIYRAAALATGKWPEYGGSAIAQTYHSADLQPGGERWPEMAAFAAENREALELYRRAAAMPALRAVLQRAVDDEIYRHCVYPGWQGSSAGEAPQDENPEFTAMFLPPGVVLREGARLLTIDAYLAATEGHGTRASADISALCGMVEHLYQIRFLIMDSVALAIAVRASDVVGTLVHDYPQLLDDAALTALAHRLAGLGGAGGLRVSLTSEYAMFDDLIQRCYTDDGDGDGLPYPGYFARLLAWNTPGHPRVSAVGPPPDRWMLPAISALTAGRREMSTKGHGVLARYEAEARMPLWERRAQDADREVESLKESPLDHLRYLPILTLMPSLRDATLNGEYAIQIRDATLTAIALELYRRHHGSWPVLLSELTPRLLPQVPPDRYDGKPLKYRLVDGQPRLYSIGVDRKDDGGRVPQGKDGNAGAERWRPLSDLQPRASDPSRRPAPDGDWVLWPPVD